MNNHAIYLEKNTLIKMLSGNMQKKDKKESTKQPAFTTNRIIHLKDNSPGNESTDREN